MNDSFHRFFYLRFQPAARMVCALLLFMLFPVIRLHAIRYDPDNRGDGGQPPLQEAVADTLEPNDDPSEAAVLFWGSGERDNEAVSGPALIASGLDLDFYRIELAAGDSLRALVTVPPEADPALNPSLSIMDSAGTVIAGDLTSPGEASVAASYNGSYLLLVTDRSLLEGSPFGGQPREYALVLTRLLRRGDIDGNGELDYRDAFLVFMLVSGLLDPGSVDIRQLRAADVDGDGAVAGDMDDFHLLMDRIGYVPARDPDSGGKQKSGSAGTTLALADGSVVIVSPDGGVRALAGGLAGQALAAWTELNAQLTLPAASRVVLDRNSPNPFNPSTTISFTLPEQAALSLAVYDVRGRLVRLLVSGLYPAGVHRVQWDGADVTGRRAASGIYFYRLAAGRTALTRKMVLVK